mmetsp:Transcript_1166/g.2619  ORF Transcript_1166/g.2619 Transcript_1166/m.2619 type:complete len:589 (+) Transcript_1166:226-1992(+)
MASYPQRLGEPECRDYLRTGRCKYGESCKYHHPLDIQSGGGVRPIDPEAPAFPIRPDEPICQYYLKHGTCKFGQTCKFNHPPLPACPPVNDNVLPQRPDEPDCIYFLRNGRCKYGATCKYHHPLNGRRRSLSGENSDGNAPQQVHLINGQPAQLIMTSENTIMMVNQHGYSQYYTTAPAPAPDSHAGSPMMGGMSVVSLPSSYDTTTSSLDAGGNNSWYPPEGGHGGTGGGGYEGYKGGQGGDGKGGLRGDAATFNPYSMPPPPPTAPAALGARGNGTAAASNPSAWAAKFSGSGSTGSTTNSTTSTNSTGTTSPLGLSPSSNAWEGPGGSGSYSRRPSFAGRSGSGDGEVTPVFSNGSRGGQGSSAWNTSPSMVSTSAGSNSTKGTEDLGDENIDGIDVMTTALLDILDFGPGPAGVGEPQAKGPQQPPPAGPAGGGQAGGSQAGGGYMHGNQDHTPGGGGGGYSQPGSGIGGGGQNYQQQGFPPQHMRPPPPMRGVASGGVQPQHQARMQGFYNPAQQQQHRSFQGASAVGGMVGQQMQQQQGRGFPLPGNRPPSAQQSWASLAAAGGPQGVPPRHPHAGRHGVGF